MSMKQRERRHQQGRSELSEDEVVSTSSIQLNEELVMLMMARSLRATKCTARRGGRGGLPQVSGDLPRGRSVEHTHTLEEEGEGPPSLSGTNRQRQPGGAPAQAGAQDRSPAEHGQARGGGVTTPQKAGLAPKEEGGISRSSPTSSQQVLLTQAHRMPDSPKQQQPPPARRARPRPPAKEEVVARAVAVVLSGGFGTACDGEDDGRRRLETAAAAAPPAALLAHLEEAAVVVVIPEGGGGKPPPPLFGMVSWLGSERIQCHAMLPH
jgi:hypothetical protein